MVNSGVFNRAVLRAILFVAASAGLAVVAQAQDATPATCNADGRSYQPGEIACIPACHGSQRLAKCEQSGGGTTWTTVSNGCPNAMSSPDPGLRLSSANLSERELF